MYMVRLVKLLEQPKRFPEVFTPTNLAWMIDEYSHKQDSNGFITVNPL
jgi:hypothetical protein